MGWQAQARDSYTATHCNTLHHTTTHCNTLHHTATHCNMLQLTATHGNSRIWSSGTDSSHLKWGGKLRRATRLLPAAILRCVQNGGASTATHCNTLQHTTIHFNNSSIFGCNPPLCAEWRCNSLRLAATRCNSLQLAATHCNSLHLATIAPHMRPAYSQNSPIYLQKRVTYIRKRSIYTRNEPFTCSKDPYTS